MPEAKFSRTYTLRELEEMYDQLAVWSDYAAPTPTKLRQMLHEGRWDDCEYVIENKVTNLKVLVNRLEDMKAFVGRLKR